jgi:hypothetical protein
VIQKLPTGLTGDLQPVSLPPYFLVIMCHRNLQACQAIDCLPGHRSIVCPVGLPTRSDQSINQFVAVA